MKVIIVSPLPNDPDSITEFGEAPKDSAQKFAQFCGFKFVENDAQKCAEVIQGSVKENNEVVVFWSDQFFAAIPSEIEVACQETGGQVLKLTALEDFDHTSKRQQLALKS